MRLFEMVLTLPQEFCTVNGRQYVPLKKQLGEILCGCEARVACAL